MRIQRIYWVQRNEILDLDDPQVRREFADYIIQDDDVADELIERMANGETVYYGFDYYGAEPTTSETFVPIS